MDRIDHLRIFMRIAACGSFSQAADQLGLPRATVSIAVRQLEARLGTRLLHRTTRRVHLTPDGEAVLDRASALVDDMEDLERRFQPTSSAISGRLCVDVPSRIARRIVAPALPDFLRLYPDITLELGSSDRMIDLVQEGVDCALRVGQLAPSSLVARPLGAFEIINCASPAYLALHGMPHTLKDLRRHTVIDFISATTKRAASWEWSEGAETRTLTLASQVAVNNAETYIACAVAGLGLIQVPRYDVQEHLLAHELVEILPDLRPAPMPVQMVYPHRKHLSHRLQAFISWSMVLLSPHMLGAESGKCD